LPVVVPLSPPHPAPPRPPPLPLHDALPILGRDSARDEDRHSQPAHGCWDLGGLQRAHGAPAGRPAPPPPTAVRPPRSGTEITSRSEEHTLNSSHQIISYAVFCLKTKTSTTR